MNFTYFLKHRNFSLKAKEIVFSDTKWLDASEKQKIYKDMVKFLNSHFKQTLFSKRLYEHFHLHCGFIAHYNKNGFYGEYFEGAVAQFHYVVEGYTHKVCEYSGNLNVSSEKENGELFFNIYKEFNDSKSYNGTGGFIDQLRRNRNYGAYSDYMDLDDAIKELIEEYSDEWEARLEEADKKYNAFIKKEEIKKLREEQTLIKIKQKELEEKEKNINKRMKLSASEKDAKKADAKNLFDFMDVA